MKWLFTVHNAVKIQTERLSNTTLDRCWWTDVLLYNMYAEVCEQTENNHNFQENNWIIILQQAEYNTPSITSFL
jgi:hypothetical protein